MPFVLQIQMLVFSDSVKKSHGTIHAKLHTVKNNILSQLVFFKSVSYIYPIDTGNQSVSISLFGMTLALILALALARTLVRAGTATGTRWLGHWHTGTDTRWH